MRTALAYNIVDNIIRTLNLPTDGCGPHKPVRLVNIIMNSNKMPLIMYPLNKLWITFSIRSYYKKGCFCIILL